MHRTIRGAKTEALARELTGDVDLTRSKKPYKELFAQWKKSGIPDPLLSNVRLFQGLRFLLGSLLDGKGHVAVPVEDARENMLRRAHG